MHIDWEQAVDGIGLKEIRELMLAIANQHPHSFTGEQFAATVRGWPSDKNPPAGHRHRKTADLLLRALAESDMLMVACDSWGRPLPDRYAFSDAGISLAKTQTRRYTRNEADEAVAGMLAAVRDIEEDRSLLFDVSRLAIYGSYLGSGDDLGDVDVSYDLRPRFDGELSTRQAAQFLKRHPRPPGHTGNWAHDATLAVLVGRPGIHQDGIIQVTPWDNAETMGWRQRQVHPHVMEIPVTEEWPARNPVRLVKGNTGSLLRLRAEADERFRDREEKRHARWVKTGWLEVDPSEIRHRKLETITEIVADVDPDVAGDLLRRARIVAANPPTCLDEELDEWIVADAQPYGRPIGEICDLNERNARLTSADWSIYGTVMHEGVERDITIGSCGTMEDGESMIQIKTGSGSEQDG